MTEYELNILRSDQVLDSLDIAINVLDSYKHHSLGQPIALLYKSSDSTDRREKIKLVLAIGKKEGGGDSSYYEIINTDAVVESNQRYISDYDLTDKTYESVGGILKGTTLRDIYERTNNGNINKLFDCIFFRDRAVLPTVTNPNIEDFYIEGHQGSTTVELKEVPQKNSLKYIISRGNVSHGTKGDNKPYAGEYKVFIKVYDETEELVRWDDILPGYSYTIRLYVVFNIGDNIPLDGDDVESGSVCTITLLYKDLNIKIQDNMFTYAGMIYDETVGIKTKVWSSLTLEQKEDIVRSLINTPEYKYTIPQLVNKITVTGKGTINDALTNKGRLVVLVPKSLQSKLVVEQNRAGVYVPWVMDVSMDINIEGIDYVAYMAASQYAIMTKNNEYRISIEK